MTDETMDDKNNWEKWLSDNLLTILVVILVIAGVSAGSVILGYWYFFNGQLIADDPAPWGQFGDFFGGTLNPIFGFLSVMALLAALVIQGRELKISSAELKNSADALNAQNKAIVHQSFEQTFFSWLGSYRELLNTISQTSDGNVFEGKRALHECLRDHLLPNAIIYEITQNHGYELSFRVHSHENQKEKLEVIEVELPNEVSKGAFKRWEDIYFENEYQLDSLFRNLYRLFIWIDSQHETRMSFAQKWLYVSIVRAQLSWIEMVYLFYNGHTERGKNFKRLVEKYALFDNLNFASDDVIAHIKEHGHNNIRYAETAYNSRLARKQLGLPESTEETLAMAVV